ncbi:hypothetical protein BpHYR1_002200 [Brachionus plicatilis]|uniref:Uncharacterized protein n=1 Tax=Brachionus plicatilis TaxID=10195 RepID=A0A3M7R2P9_BRAPC|nr:hypothetical protein BpHYR1_002200 [Brachionus plicatilis]
MSITCFLEKKSAIIEIFLLIVNITNSSNLDFQGSKLIFASYSFNYFSMCLFVVRLRSVNLKFLHDNCSYLNLFTS